MIEITNVSKRFGDVLALNDVSMTIREGEVFGLVGTNGAGKSTLLRILAGVLAADSGIAIADGRIICDNPDVKKDIFFLSDDAYFLPNATPDGMFRYLAMFYPASDEEKFHKLTDGFGFGKNRKIATFSKGMKKQLLVSLGIASGTRYLLCDETFDGLDPVARQGVKSLIATEMEDRGLTPVIASHSLRELEDISDHIGLLHKGGILLSENLDDMKLNLQKVQIVFTEETDIDAVLKDLHVLKHDVRGRLHTITLRGAREEIVEAFQRTQPVFFEHLALTLEEIFISETEVVGYDVRKFLID